MLAAARESLKALGIEDRQALIVCHNDEPHPHIHVIVNRVSPADGRLSSTSQEKLRLSHWAEDWERRHGKIFCEQRVVNNAERDHGRFVKDRSGVAGPPSRPQSQPLKGSTTIAKPCEPLPS